jgi:hypothetical protein
VRARVDESDVRGETGYHGIMQEIDQAFETHGKRYDALQFEDSV